MASTTTGTEPSSLYQAKRGQVTVLDVPEMLFATVDGQGPPAGTAFQQAVPALYGIAYGVRFALRGQGTGEKVSPLEALWWTQDPAASFAAALAAGGFTAEDMGGWCWRALIRLPSAARTAAEEARREAGRRHPEHAAALAQVRIEPWREGLSAQTLHVGPYADELPTVRMLHEYIATTGYRVTGRHHEIYLGDPRRSAPERLRTILRQPVEPAR
jgi:hypothetical protein